MALARLPAKDPSDRKDYSCNWEDLLRSEGSPGIATSTWSASSPSGLTVESVDPYAPTIIGYVTVAFVSGGTAGIDYTLTNTIVTTGTTPRTHERSIIIPCREL